MCHTCCAGSSQAVPSHTALSCLGDDDAAVDAAQQAGLLPGTQHQAARRWQHAQRCRHLVYCCGTITDVFMSVNHHMHGAEHACVPAGDVALPAVGATGKPFLFAAATDAMVKGNRYKSAGRSSSVSQDSEHMFFGQPHKQLMVLSAAGQLPLSSAFDASSGSVRMQAGGSADAAADAAAADDEALELDAHIEHQCHPRLSCARETSVNNSISDECGIAGVVCTHGQPLLGCMLAMPAPERFLYFDLLVSYLLHLVELQVLFLDTGCTYTAHWRLHMPEPPPAHIKVPWWHGRGHGSDCFLRNSGFYLPGESMAGSPQQRQADGALWWRCC